MPSERIERRLTAILAAADHLRSLVDPKIAEHRGRVVKNTGDGMQFASVVDALCCAVDGHH